MTNTNLAGAVILAVAEAIGAYLFFKTKSSGMRKLMTSFGLGFAIAIVFFDLLPDATEHYSMGYALFAVGALSMFGAWSIRRKNAAKTTASSTNSIAVGGMALHNLGEGVLLASMTGPLSFLFFAGALLHKLPEGMATYSLLGGVKEKKRFAFSALVGVMIPLGAMLHIPSSLQQPVMALLSGMILVAVSTTIMEQSASKEVLSPRWRLATPYVMGALIGVVSCFIA